MVKEVPLFKNIIALINQISILPYTDEELDSLGCLGFDLKKNKDFAEKYMEKLYERRSLIDENKRIAFSDLNVQLYQEVLEISELQQIPNWIIMPQKKQENPIRARIVALYENNQHKQDQKSQLFSIRRDNDKTIE